MALDPSLANSATGAATGTPATPIQAAAHLIDFGPSRFTQGLQALMQADPVLSAYLQARAQDPGGAQSQQLERQLQPETVRALQVINNQGFNPQADGSVQAKDPNFMEKYGLALTFAPLAAAAIPALVGAGAAAGGGGAGAAGLGGVEAATATGVPAAGVGASLAGPTLADLGGSALASTTIGTGLSTLPAGSAGASLSGGGNIVNTGTSLFQSPSLWSSLIGTGAQLAGSLINANAQGNATEAQTKAAEDSLNFLKQVYQDKTGALAPYRALGTGAVSRLSDLYGFPASAPAATSGTGTPSAIPPQTGAVNSLSSGPTGSPAVQSVGTGGNLAQLYDPPVTLRSPDGTTRQFPQSQAQYYLSKGATIVPQGMA